MLELKKIRILFDFITIFFVGISLFPSDDIENLCKCNTNFALKLYSELKKDRGNLFFSPYSISQVLTMAYAGAKGETALEIKKTLSFTLENHGIYNAIYKLNENLKQAHQNKGADLYLANSLWLQTGYPLLPDYISLLNKYFQTVITPVDFKGSSQKISKLINLWVEKTTKAKIKNFINSHSIQPDTVLILINAIYFKAKWQNRFDKKQTIDKDFIMLNGQTKFVPFMQQRAEFGYTEIPLAQILELPYAGNRLSMLILLPAGNSSLEKLENELSVKNLAVWLSRISNQPVNVTLPRLKITWGTKLLNDNLISLGMRSAFLPGKSDFSAMDGSKTLFISQVLHKAFIEVNESGSEAAAASAVTMKRNASRGIEFNADHPFLFLIFDRATNSILFIGRVTNPE